MSVVGATDWYKMHVENNKTSPSEANLVLGFYLLAFVSEAAKKLGPTRLIRVISNTSSQLSI
jgi:hypothetical protein